jgi:hypothetical protein
VDSELVDGEARYASLNGSILDRPLSSCDFHSILPKVSLRPWTEVQKENRSFVTSVSRIMSGPSSVRSHWD